MWRFWWWCRGGCRRRPPAACLGLALELFDTPLKIPDNGIALLVFALLAGGCSPPPPLRVGSNQWVGYEALYLARSLGHYDPTLIKLVELPSSTEVQQALRDGLLEAGALTLDEGNPPVASLATQASDGVLDVHACSIAQHGDDDVGAARAAGVKIIIVPDGYTGVPASELGADHIVDDLRGVPARVREVCGISG